MKVIDAEIIDEKKPFALAGVQKRPVRVRGKGDGKSALERFWCELVHAARFDTRKGPMPR